MPTHQIVSGGIVQAPEGRQIFGTLSVRENLMLGASGRTDRDAFDADLQRVFSCFRSSVSEWASGLAPCPVASSRCWRLAVR